MNLDNQRFTVERLLSQNFHCIWKNVYRKNSPRMNAFFHTCTLPINDVHAWRKGVPYKLVFRLVINLKSLKDSAIRIKNRFLITV